MKTLAGVLVSLFLLSFAVVSEGAGEQGKGSPQKTKPDLAIRSFQIKELGKCEDGKPIVTFAVEVANLGSAASPRSTVEVKDQHSYSTGWGASVALDPIAPGASRTVLVPVIYQSIILHISSSGSHPFKAKVDPANAVPEIDKGNNESAVVNVDIGAICKKN